MGKKRKQKKQIVAFMLAFVFMVSMIRTGGAKPVFALANGNDLKQSETADGATAGDAAIADEEDKASDVSGKSMSGISEAGNADESAKTLFVRVEESGCNITINAPAGSLPYPEKELSVSAYELKTDSIEYFTYLSEAAEVLGENSTDNISFARFFDIEILRNGEKIEPLSPVEVKIEYDEAPEISEDAELSVVHFAEEGTEVISDIDVSDDATEIVYEQESFSITGTVIFDPEETAKGRFFALVVKYNGSLYTVQDDGSLVNVISYTENAGEIEKVTAENPMMWNYVQEDGNTYIRYNSEGYQFNGLQLAEVCEYTFIAPNKDNGLCISTPEHENDKTRTVIRDDYGNPIYHPDLSESKIGFDNGNIYSDSESRKYLVVEDGKIKGNADNPDNNVKFYLVRADKIHDYENETSGDPQRAGYMVRDNQVDHIDIEIEKTIEEDIPLAYGNYYDEDGNLVMTVTSPTSIHLSVPVTVSQEQLRNAEIHAYKRINETGEPGEELNDAFYITGYSANDITTNSSSQIRIEGLFKVAYCEPSPYTWNQQDAMTDRLNTRIIYTVKVIEEDFEFNYYILDPDDPETDPKNKRRIYLYNSEGQPLSIKTDVTVSAKFDYFDENNLCPPLQDYAAWQNGAIHNSGISGMDFKLRGEADIDLDPVAINIHKNIIGVDGTTTSAIIPDDDQDFVFNLYSNTDETKINDVKDLNRNTYNGVEYNMSENDYVKIDHTRTVTVYEDSTDGSGLSYDYNIPAGMIGISEDKNSVPDIIVDKDGVIWAYEKTIIKTEYVTRNSSDNSGDVHVSKTYTKDDDEFFSIPEVLGDYTLDNGTQRKSEFVEFFVENYYNKVTLPVKEEVSPYEGTGTLGAVKVGDEITYSITCKNYKDTEADIVITDVLDTKVGFVSATGSESIVKPEVGETGTVKWTISDAVPGQEYTVYLTVKVLEGALSSKGGEGKVVNGGDTATVKVGINPEHTLNEVTNPVPEAPVKQETAPYEGTGTLGAVKVGDQITYEISFKNYKTEAADIIITDTLDPNVELVRTTCDYTGTKIYEGTAGVIKWTLSNVPANTSGKVTLIVKVTEDALDSNGGPGEVVNGGETATVKVGEDHEFTLNKVTNPVPEVPVKQETAPYEGTGTLGAVMVDDEIIYEISYKNYKTEAADIIIKDILDPCVEYVDADSDYNDTDISEADGIVTWKLNDVPAGKDGTVTLTVKVLEGALSSNGGEGKVVNGGDATTVKVGEDHEYTLNEVTNPVPEVPVKKETAPYEGMGTLGAVKVGEEITYEISYKNYKSDPADITIRDLPDVNVEVIDISEPGRIVDGVVIWELSDVPAGEEGRVTLTVKVLKDALVSENGDGVVVNGGANTTVQVDNDQEFKLNKVTNPVPEPPIKVEDVPYQGAGTLGPVNVGDEISYVISYMNYKDEAADIVISDTLDANVKLVEASNEGQLANADKNGAGGVVTWTLEDVPAGENGTVTLIVEVLSGALESNGGPGEVVNGGETATVKVGNDNAFELNTVSNPVPDAPVKKETAPYEGTGTLGAVKVGEEITYEISYKNYKSVAADVTIEDKLDTNVALVSAEGGLVQVVEYQGTGGGKVTWTIKAVEAGAEGKVTLTVRVLPSALISNGGPGKVVNGGSDAKVCVGNDKAYELNKVENPVPETPVKSEISPYEGTGVLGGVNVDDEIIYSISYKNYKNTAADVVIKDKLDDNVEYVSSSNNGTYDSATNTVMWKIEGVKAGEEGTVTLTVKVLKGALKKNGGPGKVVNGGDTATVQVGNDNEYTLNEVENPVPKYPSKSEISPYEGIGELGAVKVGDEITYEIYFKNYKDTAADIVIRDTLDPNVEFVEASDNGKENNGVVTWTLTGVAAGEEGTVTLTVKVLKGALESEGGLGKVVNGGKTSTVKVGNDNETALNKVTNPVPDEPVKKEITPYEGTGVLGAVKVGDEITYEISYKNYKNEAAAVVIKDKLDNHVEFVKASNGGVYNNLDNTVIWTLDDVAAGKEGKVTLTVKVLDGALTLNDGPGKVTNGGKTATVKVGNDAEFNLNTVENPVPELPLKVETSPYEGAFDLGPVKPGDQISYEISYMNYKNVAADVVITDTLDENVRFVSASNDGELTDDENGAGGIVTWTLSDVPAGEVGTVKLTVEVLETALESQGGSGFVINGGDETTVKVGNDSEYTVNIVLNPVPDNPVKKEVAPFEGTGTLGSVKVGDEITYEISYKNYRDVFSDIVIKDKLDENVEFVSASDNGSYDKKTHTVTWNLTDVPDGEEGSVTLTVKVLKGALISNGGSGKVVNGGETATVKVGNDPEFTLNTVENPVDEETTEDTSETTEDTSETTEDTSETTEDTSETTEDTSETTEDTSESTEDTSETTEDTSETTEDTSETTENTSESTEDTTVSTEETTDEHGNLIITVYEEGTNRLVPGAEIEVTYPDGTVVTYITDENGRITLTDTLLGGYTIIIRKVPEGYSVTTDEILTCTVTAGHTTEEEYWIATTVTTENTTETTTEGTTVVKTDDPTQTTPFMLIMLMSAAGICLVIGRKRKLNK